MTNRVPFLTFLFDKISHLLIKKRNLKIAIDELVDSNKRQINGLNHDIRALNDDIIKLYKLNKDLQKELCKESSERSMAIKYLDYCIENPPKYKLNERFKTFIVIDRKLHKSFGVLCHSYMLRCALTGEKMDKYFTEVEMDKIKNRE